MHRPTNDNDHFRLLHLANGTMPRRDGAEVRDGIVNAKEVENAKENAKENGTMPLLVDSSERGKKTGTGLPRAVCRA